MSVKPNSKQMNNRQSVSVDKWNNSIFIPTIPFELTKNELKECMESNIGKVHRIDFATFNSDNGSGRRAFVHFDETYSSNFVKNLRMDISQKGHADISYIYAKHRLVVRIMINKNPVPETDKTIHQVASEIDFIGEKIRLAEEDLSKKQDEINDLKYENEKMNQFMENMFYMMKSMESEMQNLRMQIQMQQMCSMPMPMPMPMPGYYMMPMVHPIVPIPTESKMEGDYNYEKLEQGEIYEEEYIEYSDVEEDTKGKMSISELVV